jgi:selenocysteine lyase/cysteine desulfurase
VHAALETYSNVHRGSGHCSMASTRLYELARDVVREHFGLSAKHAVIFCTPRRADALEQQLGSAGCRCLSSEELGLPLGLRALAIEKRKLRRAAPREAGGGTARLVGPEWVVWAKAPSRFEPGTPAIVNVIAMAKALLLQRESRRLAPSDARPLTAAELLRDELDGQSGQELLDRLRPTLIGRGLMVPCEQGERAYVNLDNGASTPTFEPIWDVVRRAWRQPKSTHAELVGEARAICAQALGAPEPGYELVFTSNTTEAIHLAAESLCNESADDVEPVVLNTLLEHNSNELPWRTHAGLTQIRLPIDEEGFVDLEKLEAILAEHNERKQHGNKRVRLVAVTAASNVLGTFNDLGAICQIAHRHGARVLVDAAQLVAHRRTQVDAWGIDYLAFSAHKVYAPFGTGVLVARKGLLCFAPEERERIRASGEENIGGIAALAKALSLLQRIGFDLIQRDEQALTARTLRGLAQIPAVRTYGTTDPDSPRFARRGGVVVFSLPPTTAHTVARKLARRGGIGIRSGCHCAHLLVKRLTGIARPLTYVQWLIVILLPSLELPGVARVSLGIENSEQDVDWLLDVLGQIARHTPSRARDVRRRMDAFVEAAAQNVYGGSPA